MAGPRTEGSAPAIGAPDSSARLFAALGDETRLRLVTRLCEEGPLSITALTDGFAITRQAVAKHLRVMEAVGLVRASRRGRERVVQLTPEGLDEARRCLDRISEQWSGALDRLRSFVEE